MTKQSILSEMELLYKKNIPFEIEDKTKTSPKTNKEKENQEYLFFIGQLEIIKDIFIGVLFELDITLDKIRGLVITEELIIDCVFYDEENMDKFEKMSNESIKRLNEIARLEITSYYLDDDEDIPYLFRFIIRKNMPESVQKMIYE